MEPDWTTNETYRAIPQMETSDPVQQTKPSTEASTNKNKYQPNNMFTQSIFDLTLITINICQICYILKVGPTLGILYYIMLILLGVSLILLVRTTTSYS